MNSTKFALEKARGHSRSSAYLRTMFPPAFPLQIDAKQQKQLEALSNSGRTPQKIALRAQIELQAARVRPTQFIAKELGTTRPTVLLWRDRFKRSGVSGLMKDAPRPGRKSRLVPEQSRPPLAQAGHGEPRVRAEAPSPIMPQPLSIELSEVQREILNLIIADQKGVNEPESVILHWSDGLS